MKYGFVYVLSNEAMPGIYKIGMTERAPSERCRELSASTSSPIEFKLEYYAEVENPKEVEKAIHGSLAKYRFSPNREFFQCSLVNIIPLFVEYVITDYGSEKIEAMARYDEDIDNIYFIRGKNGKN